jgi:hypothetical protein
VRFLREDHVRARLLTSAALSAVLALLLFSAVHARAPDLGETSPAMWRAWRPLLLAFGSRADLRASTFSADDVAAAVSYLRASSAVVRKADAQLLRDAQTEAFRKRALASLEDFDLADFHALLPHSEAGFRSFSFAGRPTEKAYAVRAAGASLAAFGDQPASLPFGHTYGALRMRRLPHASERRYLVQTRSLVGLGALRWQALLAGLSDAGRLIETPVAKDVPLVLRAADTYLRTRQSALGSRDRGVLASVWGGFPGIAQVLLPISRTDDLVAERDRAPGVTGLSLATRWDLAGMARKYPALAHYFDALDDIARAHVRLSDAAGNTLLELDSDTAQLETKLRGLLSDGRLLARAKSGALSAARFAQMRLTADLHFVLHHIRLSIEDLELDLSYRAHARGADLVARHTRAPKVSVSGAAFGLLPTRVLDWFIPGDVESLARRMFEVAAAADAGRGSRFAAHFRESAEGATLELGYDSELLDSALIRFCMAVIADAAIPSDDEERDITRLAVDYRDAFDSDLARFERFGASTFVAPPAGTELSAP